MPHVASFEHTMNTFLKHYFNSIANFKLEIAYVPCDEIEVLDHESASTVF